MPFTSKRNTPDHGVLGGKIMSKELNLDPGPCNRLKFLIAS